MADKKPTDNEVIKAFDILDKFEFFGGQRAGRELWFNKPTDIQNKDIGGFLRDLDFLKQFINSQKEKYDHLLKVACKMHTWIFLNTGDEQAAYDEIGLSDEDNILLGYMGEITLVEKE